MTSRPALTLALCAVLAVGCGECSLDVGPSFDARCAFHDTLGQDIESDEGKLGADVFCDPSVDCGSDRRALLRGTTVEYKIVVPSFDLGSGGLRTGSTDEDILSVELHRVEDDPCDGSKIMHGTAEFRGLGEAALVVYDGDTEIDRYTTVTYDADHLELIWLQNAEVVESLAIDESSILQLSVVSADGMRLIGGRDFEWEVGDETIARINEMSTGKPKRYAVLDPVAVGTTTLRVRSSGLMLEVPLEVTGVNLTADGGVADGGIGSD